MNYAGDTRLKFINGKYSTSYKQTKTMFLSIYIYLVHNYDYDYDYYGYILLHC